jgi:hypothetical protein
MKKLIVSDASLSRMKFNELCQWVRTAVQFHPACGWHRSHLLSRHEWLRTLDFPHEQPKTKLQEKMAHETLRDLVWWYKWQHQLKPHEWEAVPKRTLLRWSASGRRHQSEVIDVSQVVRMGNTEETDGGPLRLLTVDTYEELCVLETFLNRESDA